MCVITTRTPKFAHTKYSAAHYFRMILANDDRPRTMHAEAERTERHLLSDVVADLFVRQEQRRRARRQVWREHTAAARARQAAHERMAAYAAERRRAGHEPATYGLTPQRSRWLPINPVFVCPPTGYVAH